MSNVHSIRQRQDDIYSEAIYAINDALTEAKAMKIPSANAASMATVNNDQKPSIRTITVCNINPDGLLIFLNKASGKALHLLNNPNVGLCFYWDDIQLQVTIEGIAKETSLDDANAWWNKQDRNYQLSSWLSEKDHSLKNTNDIKNRRQLTREKFMDERIPMPEHWAAFRIEPTRVELWKASWKNFRGRISYHKENDIWVKHTHNF